MVIQVRVKPRSRTSRLEKTDDGTYTAHLKSPPVDGKANAELIALLAQYFSAPKSAITIKSGASARLKLVKIDE